MMTEQEKMNEKRMIDVIEDALCSEDISWSFMVLINALTCKR